MPIIYLSPSTQEYNPYVNTGTEEYWMNRLADAMEPILDASGIRYDRNTPDMTAASSIAASNAGSYDLHLALHSNAAGQNGPGSQQGILAFYYPGSYWGMRAAQILADGLKAIYPLPNLVRAEATISMTLCSEALPKEGEETPNCGIAFSRTGTRWVRIPSRNSTPCSGL